MFFYEGFLDFIGQQSFHWGYVWKVALFLKSSHMPHMWYMPMIIGIYLFLPFIANALCHIKKNNVLFFPISILGLISFLLPLINVLRISLGHEVFASLLDVGFSGGVYGLYLITGFLIKRKFLKSVSTKCVIIGFLTMFMGSVCLQSFALYQDKVVDMWYNWGTVFISSLFLFEVISRIQLSIFSGVLVRILARYSFAIYLTHYPIILIFKTFVLKFPMPIVVQVFILSLIALIGGYCVSVLIVKIPKVGNKILYMR